MVHPHKKTMAGELYYGVGKLINLVGGGVVFKSSSYSSDIVITCANSWVSKKSINYFLLLLRPSNELTNCKKAQIRKKSSLSLDVYIL